MKTIPGNTQIKNLDVLGLDREPKLRVLKGAPGELASDPYLSVVCPSPAQPDRQVDDTRLVATNTFRSRKPLTLSKRSISQS